MRLRTRILSERFFTEEQGRTVEVVSEGLNEAGRWSRSFHQRAEVPAEVFAFRPGSEIERTIDPDF